MPHLTIEYTDNLPQFNISGALLALNKALVASGHFEEVDIKSRAIQIGTFLIGTSSDNRAFVHVKLAILCGRSIQIKHELSESLLHVLKESEWPTKTHVQLCVEVQEIEREAYSKSFIGSLVA
ncbi:5-carboxymethyl-2-hydroxymuconate Delta-isomerase [Pseudoduganella namucuonensis]|uniref:5-carboxymethyl-2-hydroxymuconate Delta-isomerase n=1 Tax=Pseudoduganella namucuonensis TaxID=1035707 RepID=UPI000B803D29|nr:5-carboxymethyl-2-hydroxymuconate Delta-isomerase [Pseudoduganella namucuonensis]